VWTAAVFDANAVVRSEAFDREFLSLLEPIPGLAALDEQFSTAEISETIAALDAPASTSGVPLDALAAAGAEGAAALAEWLNRCADAAGGMCGLADMPISLIPKGGVLSFDPLGLRPIQVSTGVYRIWAKAVDRRLRGGLLPAGALSELQGAFQEERGAADIPYLLRLLFEQAGRPLRGDQLVAAADWAKMYDRTPRWGVLAVFERLGVPPRLLRCIGEVLTDRRCRFRTAHGLSDAFEPRAGIPAGCPFACLCAVLLADLPLRRIAADCRGSWLGPPLRC
jgi:hypothetical protein